MDITRAVLLQEEEKRLRRLRVLVDLASSVLMQSDLTLEEARSFVDNTKRAALAMFPDKEFAYDLIYSRRFQRIISERYGVPLCAPGEN